MTVTVAFINSFFIGTNIESILYGIELVLYFTTLRSLWENRRKAKLFYALFSSMMVLLVTVWIATEMTFSESMLLFDSRCPGGAVAYWDNSGVWYHMDLATMSVVILQLMTDALMIYRCRMVWNSYRAVVTPIILWFATLVFGVLTTWLTSSHGSNYYTGGAANFSFAYWTISVFLHTTLTFMVCYRVMRYGLRAQEQLGKECASLYFAVVAMVIESVLPYTLSGIAFLVALGASSPTSAAFIRVHFLMMCISPQMLILRVAEGKALSDDTFGRLDSAITFSAECSDSGTGACSKTSSNGCLPNGDESLGSPSPV